MDIRCLTCGESWDVDHVLYDSPEDFRREGCRITRCPACSKRLPTLSQKYQEQLGELAEAAEMHGNDVDAFAAFLDDFGDDIFSE